MAAAINYVSSTQINVQVPSNVSTGQKQVVVRTASGASSPYNLTVNATQPGFLAPPSFIVGRRQYVVALFADGAAFAVPPGAVPGITSKRPKPGDTLILFGAGFGPVAPNVPAGQIAPGSTALVNRLQISIGGVPAQIQYAGLAPGYVGLYQVNFVVPNVAANDVAPLTFTLGNTASAQSLVIPVQN